jgi:hypothetical protein
VYSGEMTMEKVHAKRWCGAKDKADNFLMC